MELVSPMSARNGSGGFMQYRPVAYVQEYRDVSTSTNVHTSDLIEKASIPANISATLLFNNLDNVVAEKIFISFGSKGDGYYNTTHYNIW